jgi:disulfide bond formation protein DsbB
MAMRIGEGEVAKTMSVSSMPLSRLSPSALAALLVAAGGLATILGAYFFQFVLGYAPCPLCLEQRIPYYVAIPLAVLVSTAALTPAPRTLVRAGLALLAVIMLVGAGLGVYHAGIEWKFWPGPTDCSGPITNFGSASDLFTKPSGLVRCDDAAWRFLGLSLAGYNVLISLLLAGIAAWGAVSGGSGNQQP